MKMKAKKVLHLVLTYYYFDRTARGMKDVEYRRICPRWKKLIWDRRHEITHVRFARGYTSMTRTFEVEKIDIGPCPLFGWDGEYYRIHFKNEGLTS